MRPRDVYTCGYIRGRIDTRTVTSIDIDPEELERAKIAAGTTTARETVDLALRTLIAVRRQPSAVERIIGRVFEPDQIDAPTITPASLPEIAT